MEKQYGRYLDRIDIHKHVYSGMSPIKRTDVLTRATAWINLENIMPSEHRQPQKTTRGRITFPGNVQNRQIHKDRREWLPGAGRREEWPVTARKYGISLPGD